MIEFLGRKLPYSDHRSYLSSGKITGVEARVRSCGGDRRSRRQAQKGEHRKRSGRRGGESSIPSDTQYTLVICHALVFLLATWYAPARRVVMVKNVLGVTKYGVWIGSKSFQDEKIDATSSQFSGRSATMLLFPVSVK